MARNDGQATGRRVVAFSEKYAPLFQNKECRYIIVTGGRGSGKSYAIAAKAVCDITRPTSKNYLYLRQTLVSAHLSIIPEFWAMFCRFGYEGIAWRTKTEIELKHSGSKLYFRGIQTSRGTNEANLKSVSNIGTVIVDEAQELVDEETFDRIDLSLRDNEVQNQIIIALNPTDDTHWIYRRFFKERGIAEDFNGVCGDTCYIHTDYRDIAGYLPADFLRLARECRERSVERYQHIWLGMWRHGNAGALWKLRTMVDPYRVRMEELPELERVVVAVDPAVTANATSDRTGIVVAGRCRMRDGTHYYILEDRSMVGTPHEWATEVADAYAEYDADRVVAEVNQGGDLVESTLRNADRKIAYKAVRATRGKVVRAEPIAELYERGLVHHAGYFAEVADEMANYTGALGEHSPDRMDALVWALTELSGAGTGSKPVVV